jgi:hypothetical protein
MTDISDRQGKAFDFVSDYTKQLITLATGIVTFTVTFIQNDFGTVGFWSKICLVLAWGFFILSILAGIMRLMALTGNLDPIDTSKQSDHITTSNVTRTGIAQIFSFALGLILSVIFGIFQLNQTKMKETKDKPVIIIMHNTAPSKPVRK